MKDVMLFAASTYFLKQDVEPVRLFSEKT